MTLNSSKSCQLCRYSLTLEWYPTHPNIERAHKLGQNGQSLISNNKRDEGDMQSSFCKREKDCRLREETGKLSEKLRRKESSGGEER